MKKKLTVISDENHKVLATQEGHGNLPDPGSGIVFSIRAGAGQSAHRIEYDVPELRSAADVQDFHVKLSQHLKAAHKKA
ncbi:MAG: hypothetical protein ACLQT5_15995 [Steroidobacteraceae bacterium]